MCEDPSVDNTDFWDADAIDDTCNTDVRLLDDITEF